MTQQDVSATTAGDATSRPRYRGRHLPMVAVVIAAFIATALAYSGMVLFGLEVAHMEPLEAYALAGFLEVSLVAVALMARNAALEGRPYGVLLTLTWVLSGTSGVFAALHEVAVPTASTPYMVVFRFVPPLVAALMWHLALVGERHLVTGHTLDERRREHRVHQYVTALEMWRDARLDSSGSRRATKKIRASHERQRAARDRALKLLTVEDFERRMQVWVERLEAAERHGSRLDTIGASSVKRGMARGTVLAEDPAPADARPAGSASTVAATEPVAAEPVAAEPVAAEPVAAEPVAAEPVAAEPVEAEPVVEPVTTAAVASRDEDDGERTAEPEPFAEDFGAALGGEPTGTHGTGPRETEDEPETVAREHGPAEAHSEAPQPSEPLPETGHTRRVEVFDLVGRSDTATGAIPRVPTWSNLHGTSELPTDAPSAAPEDAESAEKPSEDDESTAVTDGAGEGSEEPSGRDRRILMLARAGLNQREIADEVKASRSTVSRVLRRFEDQKPGSEQPDDELALAPA
ncbi:Homeodomain-like domain-containing protein [Isoptericola sp. CG 20/1183]|uniref:Homeodomain-like domain-containing protein n=1 Tax=Isoptericola halotolerans TaxID=300560 RepID=A0ABX5EGI8_9MICO|nr:MULTISPECIES: helix-turn-helix domain-containing protein [Isoptericola]PRZ06915.1 Homeodomain-like domain-containing protein [Isoptericola halotolerans]PRZ07413.1 Homeodomain-like domain-containing protein [Isoptericola sp. CG 20/1183]